MLELSRYGATPFAGARLVAWLLCSLSGLAFTQLTACNGADSSKSDSSPQVGGGTAMNPDGTLIPTGGAAPTGMPVGGGSGFTQASGGAAGGSGGVSGGIGGVSGLGGLGGVSGSGGIVAGSGGASGSPNGPPLDGSCAAVPVPVATGGRELHVTVTGNDANANGSAALPYGSLSAAVHSAVAGDTVLVHGGTYALKSAQALSPSGHAGSPVTIRAVAGESVIFDGTGVVLGNYDGLIRVSGSYAVIDGFEVVNSVGGGIQLVGANQVMVRRCRIHNIAFQALGGTGNDIVLQQNEVYDSVTSNLNGKVDTANNGSGWSPAVLSFWVSGTTRSKRWTVEGNLIHDNWGECLDALHLEDSVFRGNVLHDCYSVNLYVDDATALRLEGNYIYNSSTKYNRAVGGESAHGIAMGTESVAAPAVLQNITIANNLILSTGVGILYARFKGLGYSGIGIFHNVIADTHNESVWLTAAPTSNGVAQNNVFSKGANNNAVGLNSAGWTLDHNLWPNGGQQGTANVIADPQFSAPGKGGTAPAGFRSKAGSPALLAGTPLASVPNDYACAKRSAVSPSIGIYE